MEDLKKKLAYKMIPEQVLRKLAKVGGKIGKAAATIDSWQNRHYYQGKGVYSKE